ncbi:hypothetical protein FB45DRAFT_875638 [Roridomyces roridus]|uniref:Uncharacterized protein n=1 Tax=Roridomyces roridus TaxID=1738132 RepID=A0AAD7F9P4_9AGAR|nr:hypothetical protein FB45DRAFT_875638 [Roridomyces roridus]
MSIAQELIDKIVGYLGLLPFAPNFRAPTQRIIFRSLKLKLHETGYSYFPISLIFQRTPRVASYVHRLEIALPEWHVGGGMDAVRKILETPTLENVEHCYRDVGTGAYFQGNSSAARLLELSPTLLPFLFRQPLREFGLLGIRGIPIPLFLELLTAAPSFYVENSHIERGEDATTVLPPPNGRTLERLRLHPNFAEMSQLLLLTQLSSFTAELRSLSISPDQEHNRTLITSVRHTLQHITFHSLKRHTFFVPNLPPLCSVEFLLDDRYATYRLFSESFAGFLPGPNSSPDLSVVIFTFPGPTWAEHSFPVYLLRRADARLAAHPNLPCIIWKLFHVKEEHAAQLADFVTLVQDGMPLAHASGKLVIETFEDWRALVLGE